MRHTGFHGVLCLLPLLVLGCGKASERQAIVVHEPDFSFGNVDLTGTSILRHSFSIENTGTTRTRIALKADCGCAVVEPTVTLEAGQKVQVPVSLTLPPRPGPFRKAIVVLDDAESVVSTCTLVGDVQVNASFCVLPQHVDFGKVTTSSVQDIELTRWDQTTVDVLHIDCPQGVVVKSLEGNHTRRVKISLLASPRENESVFEDRISIRTAHQEFSEAFVPVKYVVPDLLADVRSTIVLDVTQLADDETEVQLVQGTSLDPVSFSFHWDDELLVGCSVAKQTKNAVYARLEFAPEVRRQRNGRIIRLKVRKKDIQSEKVVSIVLAGGDGQ